MPSLFEQFDPALDVKDQWGFCETLGKEEAKRLAFMVYFICVWIALHCRTHADTVYYRQLEHHWETWVTEDDVAALAAVKIFTPILFSRSSVTSVEQSLRSLRVCRA